MNYSIDPSRQSLASDTKVGKSRRIWPWLLLILVIVAAVIVWRQPWRQGPGGMAPPGLSEQAVSVTQVTTGDIPITLSSLGTVTSLATVTVKSQISGYLTEVSFREGLIVRKGDVLAQVDARPYQALLEQYEGQLAKDQAQLDNARVDLERYDKLIKQDSTSKQTADTAAATVRQYEGTVRSDQAQVETQRLNLAYCRIVSPIDGRVGLRQVDVGNYVSASDTSGIVVVTQTTPISVVFTVPETQIRGVMQRMKDGKALSVVLHDRSSSAKLAEGTLDSIDSQIDTTTGTVKLKALIANADDALFPNQFVNVTLLLDTLKGASVVPTRAVQTGTPGAFVYRVNDDKTVSLRKVTTGPSANGMVAIESGLAPGDSVVIDGIDHLSDGAKIRIPATVTGDLTPVGTTPKP